MQHEAVVKKTYYRFLKVVFWILLVLSFIAPLFKEVTLGTLYDSLILVGINSIILQLIWKVVLYIAYGKVKYSKEYKQGRTQVYALYGIWGLIILVVLLNSL